MDLSKYKLTFLLNRQEAIQVRNAVQDELNSWDWMLDPQSINAYLFMIQQLNQVIDNLKESR